MFHLSTIAMNPKLFCMKSLKDALKSVDLAIYCKNILVSDIVNSNSEDRARLRLLSDSYNALTELHIPIYFDDIFNPCRFYSSYFKPLFSKGLRELNLSINDKTFLIIIDFSLSRPVISFYAGSKSQSILSTLKASSSLFDQHEYASGQPAWSLYLDFIVNKYYTCNNNSPNAEHLSEIIKLESYPFDQSFASNSSSDFSVILPPLVGNLGETFASDDLLNIGNNSLFLTPFLRKGSDFTSFRYKLFISFCISVDIPIAFDPLFVPSSAEYPFSLRKLLANLHADLACGVTTTELFESFSLLHHSLKDHSRSSFSNFVDDACNAWVIIFASYEYYTASYDSSVDFTANAFTYAIASESQGSPVVLVGRNNFTGGYGKILDMYVAMLQHLKRQFTCIDIKNSQPFGPSLGNTKFSTDENGTFRCDRDSSVIIIDTPPNAQNFNISDEVSNLMISTIAESESIPKDWISLLSRYKRILIPTDFNRHTFSESGVPFDSLGIVPYFVDSSFFCRLNSPDYSILRILCIASSNNRKDIASIFRILNGLVSRGVEFKMVLKYMHNVDTLLKTLQDSHGIPRDSINYLVRDGCLSIIGGNVSDDFIRDLHRSSNIYLTTERSKGWDLPAHEAMSCGNPVVSIWGSASSFLNANNSFLVHGHRNLCVTDSSLHTNAALYSNSYWQDVSVDSFVHILHMLSKRTDLIRIKGLNAILDARSYNVSRSSAYLRQYI
ncbi:hypothetical protein N8608_02330 [bacterium]|nr:hypothetical protein [bacterium]